MFRNAAEWFPRTQVFNWVFRFSISADHLQEVKLTRSYGMLAEPQLNSSVLDGLGSEKEKLVSDDQREKATATDIHNETTDEEIKEAHKLTISFI